VTLVPFVAISLPALRTQHLYRTQIDPLGPWLPHHITLCLHLMSLVRIGCEIGDGLQIGETEDQLTGRPLRRCGQLSRSRRGGSAGSCGFGCIEQKPHSLAVLRQATDGGHERAIGYGLRSILSDEHDFSDQIGRQLGIAAGAASVTIHVQNVSEDIEVVAVGYSRQGGRAIQRHVVFDVIVDGVQRVFAPSLDEAIAGECRSGNSVESLAMTDAAMRRIGGLSALRLSL